MADNIFAPTSCSIFDRASQLNPGLNPDDHVLPGEGDMDTLVMVSHDGAPPSIKRETGKREVDGRMVGVRFISGPLSGKKGMIARYKLSPHDTR